MKTTLSTTILLLFTHFCLAQDFWMQLEVPEDTGVYCIKGNTNGQTYLGARGFHISLDHGLNWNPTSFTELAGTIDVNLLTGDIFVGNHLGVFYSVDNGENWYSTSFNDNANIIFISKCNSIFVGNWTGIYKSPDFGETWEQVLEAESGGWVVNAIIENSDGILFAGVTDYFGGGGVYRSLDNGDTWEHAGLNNKFISSFAINSNGMLFAGTRGSYDYSGSGVFLSEDLGNTWAQVAFSRVTSLAIDPNDVIYAGCENVGVIRSIDNGEYWELIVSGMGDYPDVDGLSLSPDGYLYAYSRWSLHRSLETVFTPNTILLQETIDIKIFPKSFHRFREHYFTQ